MNERIDKLLEQVQVNPQIERLAKQAGCSIDRLGYGEGNMEKFAELIVRECHNVVFKNTGPRSALNILEHFDYKE